MKLKFNCEVNDKGEFILYNKNKFASEVTRIFTGKKLVLTIERKKRSRSLPQNAYLHGVVIPMCKQGLLDVGYKYTYDETKTDLKRMFAIHEKVNEETGEVREYIKDTSAMSTVEMLEFIADIQQWAAEYLSIVIPSPNEQTNIEFSE